MEFRQIQYFITLYEDGSVTRAARRLHIVQSALSMQMAKLEAVVSRRAVLRSAACWAWRLRSNTRPGVNRAIGMMITAKAAARKKPGMMSAMNRVPIDCSAGTP